MPGFESSDRLYVEKAQIMAKSPGLECSNCENSEFIGPGLIVWDQFYQFKLITLNCLQSLVQKRMRYRNGNRSCKLKLSTSLFQQKADDGDEENDADEAYDEVSDAKNATDNNADDDDRDKMLFTASK